ncbi:ERAD-associated protein [Thecaphora frezii]
MPVARRRSARRSLPTLAFAFAALALTLTAALATRPDADHSHNDAAPASSAAADPLSRPFRSQATPETPQQAYERALALLRSTIKAKPKPSKSSKPHSASNKRSSSSSDGDEASRKQQQDSQHASTTPSSNRDPLRISFWDILLSWTPLGTLYRLVLVFFEVLGLRSSYSTSTDAALSFPTRSAHRSSDPNDQRLGPPLGPMREELKWPGARPVPLWPDWDHLGPGLVPLSSQDTPWDSVMFGPFHADWEADEPQGGAATILQDVSLEHNGSAAPAASPLWQHPAVPSAIRRKLEAGHQSVHRLLHLQPPWSQAKRQRRESLRAEMEQRRSEAISLLEWAGWGRRGVDWEHEAYHADSTADVLADLFATSSSDASAGNTTSPRVQAHADALWVLAEHSLWGTHGATPHLARARACYQRLVDLGRDSEGQIRAGNASAHARLAFLEGSGWESTIRRQWAPPSPEQLAALSSLTDEAALREVWKQRRDTFAQLKRDDGLRQAKALLHYTHAAEAGDAFSQMALGFRYRAGIGTKPTCTLALHWYEKAAKEAYRRFQTGPPGGLTIPYSKLRLSDLDGGAYGPGASAASTGLAALKPAVQASLNRQPGNANDPNGLEDMLEYHIYHAERGDARFMLLLARVYYQGSIWSPSDAAGAVRRDYQKAMAYLLRITRQVWPKDAALVGRGGATGWLAKKGDKGEDVQLKVDDKRLLAQAGSAASLVGRMYLRGEGVRQDFGRAWVWFSRGAETGDGDAYNGLGMMLRDGLGVAANAGQATEYFKAAAEERSLEGTINLAKVHMAANDLAAAVKALELTIRSSQSFEAYYLMASIHAQLSRLDKSPERCRLAVAGYKQVVERGDWGTPVFHKAERAWRRGKKHKAVLGWALAGEMGYEAAQNNVAYILDRDKRRLRLGLLDGGVGGGLGGDNSTDRLALLHWTRSAGQENVDAMVKMGDYYFHGLGTRHPGRAAYDKAAACYAAAAERQVSALAYWNMGWLYETGLGVARRDFHLAKRYYDMAVDVNDEAYLPVMLSLIKLHVRALWAAVWRNEASDSAVSLFSSYATSAATDAGGEGAYTEAEEIAMSKRKRLEEERRRRAEAVKGNGHEEGEEEEGYGAEEEAADPNLPETWQGSRRSASSSRKYGEEGGEDQETTVEAALIVVAMATLAYLAYVRQGVQLQVQMQRERERQEERERMQRQGQGGGGGGVGGEAAGGGGGEGGGGEPWNRQQGEGEEPWQLHPHQAANALAGV